MKSKKYPGFLFLMFLFLINGNAQSDINIKLSSIAFDLKPGSGSELVLFEPGLVFSYEFFLRDRLFSTRFSQGIRMDNEKGISGFTSGKLHIAIYQKWKTEINISAGTGLAYRMDFGKTSDQDNNDYSGTGKMKTGNMFVAGGVEFNYSLNRKTDLSISAEHFYPNKIFLNAGIRYWISKKIKKRHKCISCPDWG